MIPGYIGLTVLCCWLQAVGGAMQKHGMASRLPSATLGEIVRRLDKFISAMFKNWLWTGGLLLSLIGAVAGVQAIAMGEITVVKPLDRLHTVFLVLIGVTFLRERMLPGEWVGVVVMLASAIALASTAGPSAGIVPATPTNLLICAVATAATAILLVAHYRWPRRIGSEFALSLCAGLLFGLGDLMIKSATGIASLDAGPFDVLSGASWAVLVATPEFYAIIVANVAGFLLLQSAFCSGRVSVIGTISGLAGTVFPVIAGFAAFNEQPSALRITAIAIMVGASILLVRGKPEVPKIWEAQYGN